jgi:hypothetical protein
VGHSDLIRMENNRFLPRVKTIREGKAILSSSTLIDCLVRDLNKTGARLQFSGPTPLPQFFKLRIETGGGEAKVVERVWQRGLSAGVRFQAPPV